MFDYKTSGVCSSHIYFELDEENKIRNLSFKGGCPGNLKGIGRLCEGKDAEEIMNILKGVTCGNKATSCPDQLSIALSRAINKKKELKNEK